MNMIKISHKTEIIEYFAVFALILSSGANELIRHIGFLVVMCVLLLRRKKIKRNATIVFCILSAYILMDSTMLNKAPTDYKECCVMIVRLAGCVVVISNIELDRIRCIFLRILSFLSVWSLFWYLYSLVFRTIPLVTQRTGWVGAFYHTLGHGSSVESIERWRNAGIFGEPGIYQIYINIAILMLLGEKQITKKTKIYLFILFTVTLITTKSSMGYLIYLLAVIVVFINNDRWPLFLCIKKREKMFLVLLFGIIMIIEELTLGTIVEFVTGTYSYASRHDDMLLPLIIAKDYPIFGIGLATIPIPIWDLYYFKYESIRLYHAYQNAMSNGLANYVMMGGFPFGIIYYICIVKSVCKIIKLRDMLSISMIALMVFLMLCEEPILPTPMFLMSFFVCSMPSKTKIKIAP